MALTSSKRKLGPGRPKDPDLPGRRRGAIIKAATQLFARDGYSNTDLQDVADRLDVGKGTLYRYFPSKRELFQAAVDNVMIGMRKAIDDATSGAEDPMDRIGLAIRSYLKFFHDHPENVELLIQERAEFRDRKQPTYFAYREVNIEHWREMYRTLIREGRIRDIPVDRVLDVIGDLIYGTMFTNYIAGRKKSLVEQADGIIDLIFDGILTPMERTRRASRRPEANE